MYPSDFTDSTSDRTTRATMGTYTTAMTASTLVCDRPTAPSNTSANSKAGIASRASNTRMMISSRSPPQ